MSRMTITTTGATGVTGVIGATTTPYLPDDWKLLREIEELAWKTTKQGLEFSNPVQSDRWNLLPSCYMIGRGMAIPYDPHNMTGKQTDTAFIKCAIGPDSVLADLFGFKDVIVEVIHTHSLIRLIQENRTALINADLISEHTSSCAHYNSNFHSTIHSFADLFEGIRSGEVEIDIKSLKSAGNLLVNNILHEDCIMKIDIRNDSMMCDILGPWECFSTTDLETSPELIERTFYLDRNLNYHLWNIFCGLHSDDIIH